MNQSYNNGQDKKISISTKKFRIIYDRQILNHIHSRQKC